MLEKAERERDSVGRLLPAAGKQGKAKTLAAAGVSTSAANRAELVAEMADRIQARAIRRCGELLKQVDPQPGKRTDLQPHDGAVTRLQAATDAVLTERQRVTAVRVAVGLGFGVCAASLSHSLCLRLAGGAGSGLQEVTEWL